MNEERYDGERGTTTAKAVGVQRLVQKPIVDRRLLDLLEKHTDIAVKYVKSGNADFAEVHLKYIEEYVDKIRDALNNQIQLSASGADRCNAIKPRPEGD
jgi:hypothetical protein